MVVNPFPYLIIRCPDKIQAILKERIEAAFNRFFVRNRVRLVFGDARVNTQRYGKSAYSHEFLQPFRDGHVGLFQIKTVML